MSQHLLLVDASGFAHRAFHTGGNQFRSDGLPTWAITGFLAMGWRLLSAIQADQPTHAAAVFDAPGKTFRHTLFPAYKNNRPGRAEELAVQLPFMRHAAEVLGFTPIEREGFEADDVIASLARAASKLGIRTTIVSSDKDFCQLVSDGLVEIVDPVAHLRILEADVRGRKFGVEPGQVPDVQALAGDAIDNIPGIDGIGLKSASALIRVFGTIEGVMAGIAQAPHHFTPGQRVHLKMPGTLERLKLYRTLATLRTDVEVGNPLDLVLQPVLRSQVEKILEVLEATGRFESIFATEPKLRRVVDRMTDEAAYEWWIEELLVSGQDQPDFPQCGCFERRLVRGGVFVPASIWREAELDPVTGEPTGQQILRCQVGSNIRDPFIEWPMLARRPIRREKYDFQMADHGWAKLYAPTDPKANPNKPIDILAHPAPRCPGVQQKRKKRA